MARKIIADGNTRLGISGGKHGCSCWEIGKGVRAEEHAPEEHAAGMGNGSCGAVYGRGAMADAPGKRRHGRGGGVMTQQGASACPHAIVRTIRIFQEAPIPTHRHW